MKVKALFSALKRSPKLATLAVAVAAAVIVPTALLAWGPDRPTYTINDPADHVTFDSITDNPAYGDERNFVRVKDASASDSTYSDNTTLVSGHQYTVYVYYHNNAASNLNGTNFNGTGVAKDVALRMEMPSVVSAGQSGDINGYISASNASPATVWDSASVTATTDTALRFVPGSATIHNFGATNGSTLPDSLMTTGTPLGYNSLNGVIPGCNEYSGYVVFNIKAEVPNFNVTKQVSAHGAGNWQSSINANVGDTVDYRVQYQNTGDVEQDNVIMKDTLPTGETYVADSTSIANSTTNGQWSAVSSNELVNGGINIGDYSPNGNAYLKYSAKITDTSLVCGTKTYTNSVSANTENGSKSASANVVVTVPCQPGKIQVCNLATKQIQVINESDFDSSKYSKNLADCNSTPVTSLPETGINTGLMSFIGLGVATAGVAYAVRSDFMRRLLQRG